MARSWSRAVGKYFPVLVAGHVEALRGVEVGVEGVAAALVEPLVGAELVPDVLEAVGGDRAVELARVVERGDGRRRDGDPRAAARSEGMKLLFDSAIDKVRQGLTSLEAAISVAMAAP